MEQVLRHSEPDRELALRAEIRDFETHLESIAAEDDSAYGKARIRLYETLLQERRHQLDALTSPHRMPTANHDCT